MRIYRLLFKFVALVILVSNLCEVEFISAQEDLEPETPEIPQKTEKTTQTTQSSSTKGDTFSALSVPIEEAISIQPEIKETKSGNVTVVFKGVDIRTVLNTLSYKSGVNIVAASDVDARVTMRLVDVPWETALQVILKNYGFTYEKEGNIIRVSTLESVGKEELQSEVHILNYSKAEKVAESVKEMLTERGKIKFDERTNAIIVTDIPPNLYKIKEVLKRLDKKTAQVVIEAKLIETQLDKDDKLGINWTLKVTAKGAKRPTIAPFDKWGSEKSMYPIPDHDVTTEYVEDKTRWIDNPLYTPGGSEDQYIHPYVEKATITSDFPFRGSETYFPNDPFKFGSFPMISATQFTFGTLDFSEFQAILELLKTRTDTKVISNPTVVTLDNKEAKVNVGYEFNIPTYERNSTTGAMEITGYTSKDVGVILTVKPHVNESGDIVIDLKPEVSSFASWDTFGAGDNAIYAPRFTTRTTETQVMVRDGQTIAIGGLITETTSKYVKKVPLLGDIPFLGELFKKTEDVRDTLDLLIFVTVRLIKDDHDDKELMKQTETKILYPAKDEKFSKIGDRDEETKAKPKLSDDKKIKEKSAEDKKSKEAPRTDKPKRRWLF